MTVQNLNKYYKFGSPLKIFVEPISKFTSPCDFFLTCCDTETISFSMHKFNMSARVTQAIIKNTLFYKIQACKAVDSGELDYSVR